MGLNSRTWAPPRGKQGQARVIPNSWNEVQRYSWEQRQAELWQERRGHHQGIRYQVRLAGNRHCVEHAVSLVCTGDWYLKSFFPDSGLFWELNLLLRAQ